jgi:hypothetical protein
VFLFLFEVIRIFDVSELVGYRSLQGIGIVCLPRGASKLWTDEELSYTTMEPLTTSRDALTARRQQRVKFWPPLKWSRELGSNVRFESCPKASEREVNSLALSRLWKMLVLQTRWSITEVESAVYSSEIEGSF